MKKNRNFIIALSLLFCTSAYAQVSVDHAIQLTGAGVNAKLNGIRSVTDSLDATSAQVVQNGSLIYAVATGSNNNFSITISPPITTYLAGMVFNFISNQSVIGPATLNVNNLGAEAIKKNINQDIGQCDIQNGQVVTVVFDGTNFQMTSVSVGAAPTPANAGPNQTIDGASTTLAANTPTTGSGLWAITRGNGGSLSNASSPTSSFSGAEGTTYILSWTITACSSSSVSYDTVSFPSIPSTISGLAAWYDAGDASTITYSIGSSVSTWADKSGNGHTVSNSNGSAQPTLVNSDINGLPALRFVTASNDYLANSGFSMDLSNRSIFVVLKENDANYGGDSRWVAFTGSSYDFNSPNGYEMGFNSGNGGRGVEVYINSQSYNYPIAGNSYAPLNIYADIASSSAGDIYVGGVPGTGGTLPASTSAGGFAIGGVIQSGNPTIGDLDGDVGEIIIYNRALTSTERDQIGSYLSAKWGISFTP